ncbi:MAG: flagellar basal body rod protein FlgB [Treponema sp.]|uniref:flagellar basal body rod protein FlgB n=1 Tax=Treponema sp. TaxID=166 RepID=UPI001D73C05A|nr:flagellar basal body rod protein FlgB [Treponema sp.]MBS7310008.1 flagellar basal body rod protein FlgB [Treponema sp.]MDD5811173.1 flagellar basal body rod protein FlgB [Treponema sp.]MDY5886210.1 flagellar basal body rod protein FlgB [Treponema sp.]
MNSFTRSVDLIQRALDVNTLRYSVAANNMANADVPNFKRTSVNFESQLKKAFESEEKARNAFELKTTEPYHIKINNVIDYKTVEPQRVVDYASTEKANGNNVNVENEAMDIVKIQMQYKMLTMLESFEFSQVKTAMSAIR